MSDKNQRLQELFQKARFRPTPRLHQIIEAGLSEANSISRDDGLVTAPFLILGILFVGRHRPQNLEFATKFYNAIGSDETDKIAKRVRQLHSIFLHSTPAEGMRWISSEYLDVLEASASSSPDNTDEISPEATIITLLEKRPQECQILFAQHVDTWETLIAATQKAVEGLTLTNSLKSRLNKLKQVSEDVSGLSEKNNSTSSRPPSNSIQDWRHYLKSRYGKRFTDNAIRNVIAAVEAAAKERGNIDNLITVNSKHLLPPFAVDSGPLNTLYLGNHAGAYTGVPPWHEPQNHADESEEARKIYGKTRPSVEFASILQTAASLTETTIGFSEVTEWHLAFAAISSSANGIKWQLHAQKSSLTAATIVLRRNLVNRQPQLEPLFNWSDLEDDHEPYADENTDESDLDDNSKRWSRAFHNLRKPKEFKWSRTCLRVLDELWHSHGLAVAFARQSKQRAKRFNPELTARSLFFASLRCGASSEDTEKLASGGNDTLLGVLFRSAGKSVEQLELLMRDEFYRGREDSRRDSDSPLVSEGLAATIKRANEIRLSTGNDPYVSTRHLIAALLHPFQGGGTGSRVLIAADEINPQPLVDALGREVATAPLGNRLDDPGGWIPLLKRLQEGLAHPLPRLPLEGKRATPLGGKSNFRRGASEDQLCLNIGPISKAIAQTFHSASEEDDFVFALYGPWGRGKTELARKVDVQLGSHGYTTIFFSAWKYPSRPEVWVHLYQEISKVALEGDWRHKLRLSFQTAILRHGWFSLILSLALLLASRFVAPLGEWLVNGLGAVGLLILVFFGIRTYSVGKLLHQRYFSLPDHADKLGLQAVIGNDLANLLKVWVAPSNAVSGGRPKSKDDLIDFREGGTGLWWRNWSIILLVATCLTLIVQIWREKPLERANLTPVALQELNVGINNLGSSLHSLESRIQDIPDKVGEALVILPRLPISGSARSEPKPSVPPTDGATSPPQGEPRFAAPWPPSKLEIEINFAPDAMTPSVAGGKSATEKAKTIPAPATGTSCPLPAIWQWLTQLPWSKLIVIIILLVIAAAGRAILLVASRGLESRPNKLLLVVDDLDRCEPEQMLAVIESLRMFLDDKAMSIRMQVMMLLDSKILEFALKNRCRTWRWPRLDTLQATREQREKWFVAELTLPPLTATDLKNTVEGIVGREARAAKQYSTPSPEPTTDPSEQVIDTSKQHRAAEEKGLDLAHTSDQETTGKDANSSGDVPPPSSDDSESPGDDSSSPWLDDCTYHDDEQEQIKQAFSMLDTDGLTPRRIRSLTLRYQLAKLILRHLKEQFESTQILACLTKPNETHDDIPPVVQQVVQSVQ